MPEIESLYARLMDRLNDHDTLIKMETNLSNLTTTLTAYMVATDARMSDFQKGLRILELKVNAGAAGLVVVMFFINKFFKS